ncbi:MAG TPA: DUF1538 domain-containing protein [Vicinamibacterales bacterium]
MRQLLQLRLGEVLRAVAPLVAVGIALQVLLVGAPAAMFVRFIAGSALAVLGMLLLFAGIDYGVLPMGRFIGAALPAKRSLWLIAAVGFAMGFATTAAEPDVLVLAGQVETISGGTLHDQFLVYVIALGVAVLSALGLLRIIWGIPLTWLLAPIYVVAIALTFVAPPAYVPLAYDAGSVTTGVLTSPVLLALALGLTSVLAARSAMSDGFGLLGLASAGPILVVLALGLVLS